MMASSAVREFRRVMITVAQQLTQQESDTLVWMHGIPVEFKGKPPLTVLAQMESQGLFSASKPERFAEVLKDINRMDLMKQVTKNTKRKKNRVDAQSDEYLNITLAANLEVTLLQSKILLEQVERLGEVVFEANERRIGEIVGDAKKSAEKLRRTLEHASGLCRSTTSTLPPSQEESTLHDSPTTSSNGGSAPTPMPSKPHIPVRLTSSPLITSKQAQQSTRTDGIYEEPCRTHQVADNKEKDLRVTSHYYSAVQGGSPVQLRPPTSPKPKPKRRATMAGTHTHGQPADIKTTSKPQKPSMIPSPSALLRRGSLPEQPHHDNTADGSDYTSTCSGDDSGFAEPTPFLKRPLTKRETTAPPDPPPRKASSNRNYYKSLTRHEDVKYYKTLQRDQEVEEVTYETCDTYETMASYKIPKEHIIPEVEEPNPKSEEHIYMNLQSARK